MKNKQFRAYPKHLRTAVLGLLAAGCVNQAGAVVGSGWTEASYSWRLFTELHDAPHYINPAPSHYSNGGCTYTDSNGVKTFTLNNSDSNRAELELNNNYSSGSRQFQCDLLIKSPSNNESAIQIKDGQASFSMFRSGTTSNTIKVYAPSGSKQIASGIYGTWHRVNYIHDLTHDFTGWYYNGSLVYSTSTAGGQTPYTTHFGIYGTLRTSAATHQFRNIHVYNGGHK